MDKTINDVYLNLTDLKTTASLNERKEKLATILTTSAETERVLYFLLNKFEITNMSKAKLTKNKEIETDINLTNFDEFLSYLENNPAGTDQSVKAVQNYIQTSDKPEIQQFLIEIAAKSLTTKINVATFNKVAAEIGHQLAPDFNVQLAENIDKLHEKLEKDPNLLEEFTVTEKLDGVRCIAIIENNTVKLYTRSGQEITPAPQLEDELKSLNLNNIAFDGELLIDDSQLGPEDKAEDAFRKTMTIIGSKHEKTNLIYHIFDMFSSANDFKQLTNNEPYIQRREWLSEHETLINLQPHLSIVPVLYQGSDLTTLFELRDTIVAQGGEGVMVNKNQSPYQFKRTKELLKVKQLNENDGVIKAVYEGNGENIGRLGGIQITYKNVLVNIGTGFSQEERIQYWNNPELLIGKVASYKFTTESTNKDGSINLRFGRWKGLRPDKTPDDVSYDN